MKPVEEYLLKQEEPYQSILLHLQLLIENEFPEAVLKYKWKIPVYYLNEKQLCYLNVSTKKGYVDVGFWVSNNLKGFDTYLVSEGRKVVKSLRYFKVEDVNVEILISVLQAVVKMKQKGFYSRDKL